MSVAAPAAQATLVGAAWFSARPAELARFYERVLGMSFEQRVHDDGREHWISDVAGVHVEVKATHATDGTPTPDAATGDSVSTVELSWRVDDVDAVAARALEHGAHELQPAQTYTWGRWTVLLDPDGNRLGLYSAPSSPDSTTPTTAEGVS